jgi:hypothetical protein
MTNFIFTAANTSAGNLSTGTFYAHCVTTLPVISNTTVANLVISNAVGYVPLVLIGLSYNSTRWTFADISFPSYNFTVAPIGIVICKQLGGSPATTDPVICYSDFTNALAQVITTGTGTYVVSLLFSNTLGAINFVDRYRYSSGAYVNTESVPPGSIYLLGSNNNTVGFTNPAGSKINVNRRNSSNIFEAISYPTDRDALTNQSAKIIAIDFINYRLQIGVVGLRTANFASSSVSVYGSNSIAVLNDTTTLDPSFWTLLGSFSSVLPNTINLVTVNNSTYWQHIKLEQTTNGTFASTEIEFYSSSMSSLNINLT